MARNLYVSYDLDNAPPERYQRVRAAIESCATGGYSWIQYSLAYVKTSLTIQQVHDRVRLAMRSTDKLAVIHALDAIITPLAHAVLVALQRAFRAA